MDATTHSLLLMALGGGILLGAGTISLSSALISGGCYAKVGMPIIGAMVGILGAVKHELVR